MEISPNHLVRPIFPSMISSYYSHPSNKRGGSLIDFEKKIHPPRKNSPSSFIPAFSPLFHSLHIVHSYTVFIWNEFVSRHCLVPFSLGKCSWQNIYYYIDSFLASLLVYSIGFPPPHLLKFPKKSNLLVYSLLHVYWFYNFCTPSLSIPTSLAVREMRVCPLTIYLSFYAILHNLSKYHISANSFLAWIVSPL